jgi:DNA phosphorothioation-dependent restriction protein DptH
MSYFAESAWDYVAKKIAGVRQGGTGRRILIRVPAIPGNAVLPLADRFASRSAADPTLDLSFLVAQPATRKWSADQLAEAERHGWLADSAKIMHERHDASLQPGRVRVLIICGVEMCPDISGSLGDFHLCDLEAIWKIQMRKSFRTWIVSKLNTVGLDAEAVELREFDRLLTPLLEHGKADLLQIGDWLVALDLNTADSARDAQRIMLGELGRFQLPKFSGFPIGRKRVALGPYIAKADAFFSYTMFLDAREREKAVKAIAKIVEALDAGEETGLHLDDKEVRGPYATDRDFLNGLRNYIESEATTDRDRLMGCDFVTLIDKVLKYRKKEDPKPRDPLHRLSGSPVEVILHAVWQTFREFNRDKRFIDVQVCGIELCADRFKHDYESSTENEDSGAVVDRSELARQYLLHLLGGVDDLVKERLVLPGESGENLAITCSLEDEQVPCVYGKTAEPQLEFSVKLAHHGAGLPYRRRFAWRLPEIQPYRLAESMIRWAIDALNKDSSIWKLPVFHIPYYEELLRATDDEETRRVMLHCIKDARVEDSRLTNLLSREWLASHDALLPAIKALGEKYIQFLRAAYDKGLHRALFAQEWTELRQAYTAACRLVVEDAAGAESQMAAMLLRCFLVVQRRSPEAGAAWGTEPFERSGVATVLHPSVIEMLEAQILFLFSCFNAAGAQEQRRDDRRRSFAEKIWTGYVDLSSIQAPIVGLLYNEDQNLDTNVRGCDLIHRIGSPPETEATLSTRMLVRYDSGIDDDDVADTEMFRESRESKLLFRLVTDYFRLHPHARDGLNLAFFRNQDIQPIIAAVHQYLNKLTDARDPRYYVLPPDRRKPYSIGVTVFTESGDDVGVARWIEQWRERWEAAETESKYQAYRSCRFSVAHRIVEARQLGVFQRLINDSFEADIAILYDFVGAGRGGNRFAEVVPFDVTARTLKFPILEKSCCTVRHPTDSFKRSRVISNRQFTLGTLHSQVMHRLKNQGVQPGREFVILGVGDFAPWRGVVDALHAKAEWVICIDPSMDERLIKIPAGERAREREIIGFGSGVGSHGEANYTISTEQFSLEDVRIRLAAAVQEVYAGAGWNGEECLAIAGSVLREARELSGLSLVRATGVGHYIRDFMAYALTRKMLREKRKVLCDNLVSLDAYRHWFDLAESERRPDLLWLTAWIDEDNRVCISAWLIECKLAQRSDEHLLKARAQISNGLRVLVPAFAPRPATNVAMAEDNRPDQRYWWLQLHRLITSKAEIDSGSQAAVLSALERLADGDYQVEWGAAVFAFWSDDDSNEARHIGTWTVAGLQSVQADIYAMGSQFVHDLTLNGAGFPKTWCEWEAGARREATNVCDALNDVELPPGEDDDEDAPLWEEQSERDEDDVEAPEFEPIEPEPGPESVEPQAEEPYPVVVPPVETAPEVTGSVEPETPPAVTGGETPQPAITAALHIPVRVLLGKTVGGGKPVYWEFGHPELANRHMVVFGTSGMGKTYAIQCLLCEFGREGQNSLVIDYTDGLIPSKLEPATKSCLQPSQHFIQHSPLPISPFKAQVSHEAGIIFKDTPISIAKRVAAIFKSVYELGNQQFSVLIDAITEGVQQHGDNYRMIQVLDILQTYINDGIHSNGPVKTTISKLKQFILSNPFADDEAGIGWQQLFEDETSRCHVFQFHMVDRHSARAVIEFVLWDLYSFVSSSGNKHIPRVVVLDEVQNLDLGTDAPVAKYLTEGRKHGLSLITATQTVKGVGGVSDARVSRIFQAEHKLFFKPTENEMREHAQLLHNAVSSVSVPDWIARLASLQKGECWSLGRSLNEATGKIVLQAQRIKITSLEERGFNA